MKKSLKVWTMLYSVKTEFNCTMSYYVFFFFLGNTKSAEFSIDACRSMVALMDVSLHTVLYIQLLSALPQRSSKL